jgi:cytochrome c
LGVPAALGLASFTVRLVTLTLLAIFAASSFAADEPSAAQQAFNNHCRECHSSKANDNRLGPSLFGVLGRRAGSVQCFPYSDAMKTSDLTWDEGTLDKFIANPDAVVANNGMKPFTGVGDANERSEIIAFLQMSHRICLNICRAHAAVFIL